MSVETAEGMTPTRADIYAAAARQMGRRMWITFGVLGAILAYLAYAWVAFEVSDLIAKAEPERAILLGTDSVKHKVHVEKNLRRGDFTVSVEGERTATYDTPPEWVDVTEDGAVVNLGDGVVAEIDGALLRFTYPGYGTIEVVTNEQGVETRLPDGSVIARPVGKEEFESILADGTVIRHLPDRVYETVRPDGTVITHPENSQLDDVLPEGIAPDWASIREVKFDARPTISQRAQMTRSKIEVHRYFWGWENFWFPFDSRLNQYSFSELLGLALDTPPQDTAEQPRAQDGGFQASSAGSVGVGADDRVSAVEGRLHPTMSNAGFIFHVFWTNPEWQHGHVFVALLETIMMAVLGTLTAVILGLPLAFLAARNFTPSMFARFAIRRVFDFVRGIDNLIWSLIFIRAFGLGPLTGALAIAITDMGTLGKLFSEALENVDNKQIEGVRATGARQLQRYRFGVIPQILPVFISQTLYYLESNTRSATVIGALGAGGIGLVLVETMRTARDWENTLYIIILTVIVVIMMDQLSSWLRRKLITGE